MSMSTTFWKVWPIPELGLHGSEPRFPLLRLGRMEVAEREPVIRSAAAFSRNRSAAALVDKPAFVCRYPAGSFQTARQEMLLRSVLFFGSRLYLCA